MRPVAVAERPYLAPWYRIVGRGRKLVLEYGQRVVCLEGRAVERLLPALLPLLDGAHTVEEIVAILGEPARPAVEHALRELAAHALLTEGPPLPDDLPRPLAGTAELLTSLMPAGPSLGETVETLARASVALVGAGVIGVEIARLLRLSGVSVEPADRIEIEGSLAVCAPSPAELPRLREWNAQALEARAPWLQVLPFDGRYASLGPLYLPWDTCCYECFRLRRAANVEFREELPLLEEAPARYPAAPALDGAVAGLAAVLVLRWLVLGDHYAPAAFYALELGTTLGLSLHHVHRVPRCPVCSGLADTAPPLPWYKEVPLERS